MPFLQEEEYDKSSKKLKSDQQTKKELIKFSIDDINIINDYIKQNLPSNARDAHNYYDQHGGSNRGHDSFRAKYAELKKKKKRKERKRRKKERRRKETKRSSKEINSKC